MQGVNPKEDDTYQKELLVANWAHIKKEQKTISSPL